MATLVHNCPHCKSARVAFEISSYFDIRGSVSKAAISAWCNACFQPVCFVIDQTTDGRRHGLHFTQIEGDILRSDYFALTAMYPPTNIDETPRGVPDGVAKAFRQAAGCRAGGHYDAAAGMYRKAMELALKAFSPDIAAWKIEKRIDKMAAEHRITPELQSWAHELRLDGNEAVHGEDEATKEITDQMHEFCKFLLIYLYTLPVQVAEAQARRGTP